MDDRLAGRVRRQADRKLKGKEASPWADFATFGIIGWSVALPTVLGVGLGLWIDRNWPGEASWTLMLLGLGAAVGCFNAWRWVQENSL
jgi:ATP synthase protein I